ncbi:hypothetical protein [Lacticaseibacillus hegangensis]|uniref:Uncharacterized protein n=1 Tax=Lacticaseibacillus hegangensis TaxID=2486010 RepID=A0ABW4CWE6_9LACO|nr:hypothetical protein [Lacticaseibacillus hegangensis]
MAYLTRSRTTGRIYYRWFDEHDERVTVVQNLPRLADDIRGEELWQFAEAMLPIVMGDVDDWSASSDQYVYYTYDITPDAKTRPASSDPQDPGGVNYAVKAELSPYLKN